MKLVVNGREQALQVETLDELLESLDYGSAIIATALNGRFVAAGLRPATVLSPGDEVEILAPMQGG